MHFNAVITVITGWADTVSVVQTLLVIKSYGNNGEVKIQRYKATTETAAKAV
jgi:hypothetical protein